MRARRWGRVVAITSIAVRQPIPNLILSNTARAGLTGFLKTLAREVAADGVTVNSLLPGSHATDRMTYLYDDEGLGELAASIPARRLGEAADFGAVAAFLCSEAARFVTGTAIGRRRRQRRGTLVAMLRHVVCLQFKPEATAADRQAIADALAALPARIPQLRDYRFGIDAGIAAGNFDFAVVADVDDAEGFAAYRDDPEHQRIIVELIRPILAGRAAVQFWID